jgi:transcriptional regulator with GAF, ATPase, and Fis domain
VRVIAATNRDLAAEVRTGRFRSDLFYRLSVFPIEIPPLRERKDDVPLLAEHFRALSAKKLGITAPRISPQACERLKSYDWPGNLRELQNFIERAVILSRDGRLQLDESLRESAALAGERLAPSSATFATNEVIPEQEWRRLERANLLAAMKRSQGRIHGHGGAAELLGLKPSTLQSRLRTLGIRPESR